MLETIFTIVHVVLALVLILVVLLQSGKSAGLSGSIGGAWTGRSSWGVLCLIALFLVGLCIMIFGKKHLEANTQSAI